MNKMARVWLVVHDEEYESLVILGVYMTKKSAKKASSTFLDALKAKKSYVHLEDFRVWIFDVDPNYKLDWFSAKPVETLELKAFVGVDTT